MRIAFYVVLVLLFVALTGDKWADLWRTVVGDPPPWLVTAVDEIAALESWLAGFISFPTLFWAATVVLGIFVLWPQIIARFTSRGRERAWFYDAFHGETSEHRDRIRRLTAARYDKWRSENRPVRLPQFIRLADVPPSLPLPEDGNLLLWSQEQATLELNDATRDLYFFALQFYPPENPSAIVSELDASRRVTAKFWDRVGRQMREGHLELDDIRNALKTQIDDLLLIVFLEVAQTRQSGWDLGPGKSGLFYIAHRARGLA